MLHEMPGQRYDSPQTTESIDVDKITSTMEDLREDADYFLLYLQPPFPLGETLQT